MHGTECHKIKAFFLKQSLLVMLSTIPMLLDKSVLGCTHNEECHHFHCEPPGPDHVPVCTNGQCSCHHAGN